VSDLNGDGLPDLAVANFHDHSVSVLLGNGDGTFQAAVDYPANEALSSLAVADFNHDGVPDLAANNVSTGSVSVFLGNGDESTLARLQRSETLPRPQQAGLRTVRRPRDLGA
jgi:hypothetical protein